MELTFPSQVRGKIVYIEVTSLFSRRVKKKKRTIYKQIGKLEAADLSYPWEKVDYRH